MTIPLGPALELQIAVVALLNGSTNLKTLIGATPRIYQDVPPNPTFPYITIGDNDRIPDLAQDLDGAEIFFDIHIWSRLAGFTEAERIGAVIHAAIPSQSPVTLTENRCLTVEPRAERFFKDPDGETKHGVLTFRALVEPA